MPAYSNSRLGTFETCPLQYKCAYVDRIKRYIEGIEAFLGQRFHEAMEMLYRERAFRLVPLEELLEFYEKQWEANWHDEVTVVKKDRTPDDYRTLGRRFIEDYYNRHRPFDEGRILGLERFLRFSLDDKGRYPFTGVIDRLMLAPDGTFEIHDYKTSSGLPDQAEVDADRQLALYQIGVQTLWPNATKVRLVWHYAAFDMEMRSERTPEALVDLKAEVMRLIDRIEATVVFEPCESVLCGWCPYWELCPVKKHLVKVEKLLANELQDEPGVKIVDAYAEWWTKKRELEAEERAVEDELTKLRDAAIAFAEKEDVSVIAGTGHKLRVTGKDRVVSPNKGSVEREALEDELRAAGVWDEVAMLDPFALEKAVADGRWEGAVLERIRAYIRTERRYTVTVAEDS